MWPNSLQRRSGLSTPTPWRRSTYLALGGPWREIRPPTPCPLCQLSDSPLKSRVLLMFIIRLIHWSKQVPARPPQISGITITYLVIRLLHIHVSTIKRLLDVCLHSHLHPTHVIVELTVSHVHSNRMSLPNWSSLQKPHPPHNMGLAVVMTSPSRYEVSYTAVSS